MHQRRLFQRLDWMLALAAQGTWLVAAWGHPWSWQLGGSIVAAFVGWGLSRLMRRQVARQLDEFAATLEPFARGELNQRIPPAEWQELERFTEPLNRMAALLDERIQAMTRQSNEQRAVMTSMSEGVIAVDLQQRVISLNRAASEQLNFSQALAAGRPLQEVIRNADLRRFVAQALASPDPVSGDIRMLGDHERVLQAHGAALCDAQGSVLGAVIVINDVSDYRRLENVRRDFVANVSHELKTPIASIKGFIETLLDGALDDRDDAERFCRIIARQAERLHSIIDDLLSLSRIEQSEGAGDILLEPARLRDVLLMAISDCQARADERGLSIHLVCDERLEVKVNAPLLTQAVLNLLDNAIKYSEEGERIELQATASGRGCLIQVRDQGCGIPPEHLPRIFERFYRVDRARSRKLGGTGLGLSIVKHIVNVHHGRVTVESAPGKGSTFSIHLPLEADMLAAASLRSH